MHHIGRYAAVIALAGYGGLYILGCTAGSTARQRRASLPGDDVIAHPTMVTNHAITIAAPAEAV